MNSNLGLIAGFEAKCAKLENGPEAKEFLDKARGLNSRINQLAQIKQEPSLDELKSKLNKFKNLRTRTGDRTNAVPRGTHSRRHELSLVATDVQAGRSQRVKFHRLASNVRTGPFRSASRVVELHPSAVMLSAG